MSTQSVIQKLTTPQNLNRVRFYLRLFFICACFIIFAVWLDYWFRGEIGIAKKVAEFVDGQWGPGILIGGGGGGISLACGISRSISWKWFLLTVVLAVSPVPLLAFFGVIQLEAFLGINK